MGYASDEIMRLDMVEKSTMESLLEMPVTPEVKNADKGKYLHANESTGALEWAEVSGGSGGVLIANIDSSTNALDKTWKQIHDADLTIIRDSNESDWGESGYGQTEFVVAVYIADDMYSLDVTDVYQSTTSTYETDTENGYPVKPNSGGGD